MITDVFPDHKRVNVGEHTVKTVPRGSFGKVPAVGVRDRKEGRVEKMEGKFTGNHLRLIPGLCLEDRTN